MSRIGKKPIALPSDVTLTVDKSVVTVKGPKGTLTQAIDPDIAVAVEEGQIQVTRPTIRSVIRLYTACTALWLTIWLLALAPDIKLNWK